MSAWLTAAEVAELTGRVRHGAQSRKLSELGVPFRLNAQGRPLVERAAVLTTETRQVSAAKFRAIMDAHGLTRGDVARMIGIEPLRWAVPHFGMVGLVWAPFVGHSQYVVSVPPLSVVVVKSPMVMLR